MRRPHRSLVLAAFAHVLPGTASASTVVVPPFLVDPTLTADQSVGLQKVVAADLTSVAGVDRVLTAGAAPTEPCLWDPTCLGVIAATGGGDAVLAGKAGASGAELVLDLTWFTGGQVVRRERFRVDPEPAHLAATLTPVVAELVSGQGHLGAPLSGSTTDAELAGLISFNQSVEDISAEEIDAMIQFGPPPGVVAGAPATVPAPAPVPIANLAPPAPTGPAPGTSQPPATVDRPAVELGHVVQFTARGGYSRFFSFDFITGGGEIGVVPIGGLHVVAGVEVYGVKRILPEDMQVETGIYSQWDTIFPINAGLLYKFPVGMAQPYVGADAIAAQYYQDEVGADWAAGGRFRAGVDVMFVDQFGLNLNLAAGAWFGQNWPYIEEGFGTVGFLPQVSAGTVLAF